LYRVDCRNAGCNNAALYLFALHYFRLAAAKLWAYFKVKHNDKLFINITNPKKKEGIRNTRKKCILRLKKKFKTLLKQSKILYL